MKGNKMKTISTSAGFLCVRKFRRQARKAIDTGYYLLICKVMSKTCLEKASPFASYCLVNNPEFNCIIWG